MGTALFLFNLIGVPVWLLRMGHRFRRKSVKHRRMFWYALIGYGLGALVSVGAMLAPPVEWVNAGARSPMVHFGPTIGFFLGLLIGQTTQRRQLN